MGIAAIAVPKIIPLARLVAPRSAKKSATRRGRREKKRAGETSAVQDGPNSSRTNTAITAVTMSARKMSASGLLEYE